METTVDNLKKGDTLAVSLKKVNGNKYQLEVAEIFTTREAENAASILNASDERFNQADPKPRRAWISAEAADLKSVLGIEIPANMELNQVIPLNILNPKAKSGKAAGKRLRVRLVETTKGTDYQMENVETVAKRAGEDGPIMKHNGQPIFANTELVFTNEQPQHVLLKADTYSTSSGVPVSTGQEASSIAG